MKFKYLKISLVFACTFLFACNGGESDQSSDINRDDSLLIQEDDGETDASYQEETLPTEIIGVYTGTLPCADCEGIEVTISINEDGSYEKSDQYLTEQDVDQTLFEDQGMIDWNSKDSIVTLISTVEVSKVRYKMGKDILKALNVDGNEVTGSLADNYILTKE